MKEEISDLVERSKAILASISDAMILTAPDGTIAFINEVATKLTGYPVEEAIGMKCYEVFKPVGETCKGSNCPVMKISEEQLPLTGIEKTIVNKSGEEIPTIASIARVNPPSTLSNFSDVKIVEFSMHPLSVQEIEFALTIENRGNDLAIVKPQVEIFDSSGIKVETLMFDELPIHAGGRVTSIKKWYGDNDEIFSEINF